MALFFNFKAQPSQPNVKANVLVSEWHPEIALLAVATDNCIVSIYNEEGDKADDAGILRNCTCNCLSWHPKAKLLCSGWKDGVLVLWNEDEGPREVSAHGDYPVSCLQWNPNGTRLLSADRSGQVALWKFEGKSKLTPILQYKKSGSITHMVFRVPIRKAGDKAIKERGDEGGDMNMEDLGDGLDEESGKGGANAAGGSRFNKESVFLFGGVEGIIYLADDGGNVQNCTPSLESPLAALLYYALKDGIVVLTQSMQLAYWTLDSQFQFQQQMKVKISTAQTGEIAIPQVMWVGPGLLVTSNNENVLRMWNMEKDENYVLQITGQDDIEGRKGSEKLNCISFNSRKRVLAGGTRDGRIIFWQFVGGEGSTSADDWEAFAEIDLEVAVQDIQWGPGETLLSASMQDSVSILHETILKRKMQNNVALIQLSPECVFVEHLVSKLRRQMKSSLRIKGLDLYGNFYCVWNGKAIEVYEITGEGTDVHMIAQFDAVSTAVAIHSDSLFIANGNVINVVTHQNHTKQTLKFSETEGTPTCIDVNGDFLAAATNNNYIKMWRLGREAKPHGYPKQVFDKSIEITSIRCNCNGSKVSILTKIIQPGIGATAHTIMDTRLHVYEVETDKVSSYDFNAVCRFPISHCWDETEPKLVGCETRRFRSSDTPSTGPATGGTGAAHPAGSATTTTANAATASAGIAPTATRVEGSADGAAASAAGGGQPEDPAAAAANAAELAANEENERMSRIEVATLFASVDKGLMLQDSFPLDRNITALIGMAVPSLFFYTRFLNVTSESEVRDSHIEVKSMPNFEGISITDPKVKEALLAFSYNLTIGNMDDAYKAVKTIKDANVWHNMAVMCVKTKRLDVAEVCLGNMQDAKAARALREARGEPEVEARTAMLAIHLNLLDDAERLYRQCRRYDLLNRLYQACGKWDLALQTAEKHDRIHLRTIHYSSARYLESVGEIEAAVKAYEASKTHRYEVPRMLYDHNALNELESYIVNSKDKELLTWWAQYLESNGNYSAAMAFYNDAEDVLSRVRLLCFMNDIEHAAELVASTNNPAAAYHLARHFEDQDMIREALHYFSIAKCYRHCIKIAKEKDMDTEVVNMALQATNPNVMIDAAEYFEAKGMHDKAVLLYQKGGNLAKAIALCVKGKLFDVLTTIADNLRDDADPEVFLRCADFFIENQQYDKAAKMLVNAKAYERALQLCLEFNVRLTEDMAEAMTLPKTEDEDSETYRIALLKKIAKVAKAQESWHLSCKKYTQAGEKLKAMKVLLKSGDKEKIIFFASHSRQRDIYVMAANFLQNLDWHNDPEVMKNIIGFYTKAHALDNLAGFYDACAQVEIDEYRDYEKALAALKEAHRYLVKAKTPGKENDITQMKHRVDLVEQFVEARKMVKTDPEGMVTSCSQLLAEADVEAAVRVGDVYALLVEFYTSQGNNQLAYQLIEKMRERNIILSYFLEQKLVEGVYAAMGIEQHNDELEHPETVEEEVHS